MNEETTQSLIQSYYFGGFFGSEKVRGNPELKEKLRREISLELASLLAAGQITVDDLVEFISEIRVDHSIKTYNAQHPNGEW